LAKPPPKSDKAERRAASERAIAEFLAKGGKIQRGPEVVPQLLVCRTCGAHSVVGVAKEQRRAVRCPKCGTIAP
jgi:hypothetical protein